jgi:hypothetical protein
MLNVLPVVTAKDVCTLAVPFTSKGKDGLLVPTPSLLFVLSQNKLVLCCNTLPVPWNNTLPIVPEVIAVVPTVNPLPPDAAAII